VKKDFNVGIIGDNSADMFEHMLLHYGGPCHFSVEMERVADSYRDMPHMRVNEEQIQRINSLQGAMDQQAYVQFSRNRAEFDKEGVRIYECPTASVYGKRAVLHGPLDFKYNQSMGLYKGLFEEKYDIVINTGFESEIEKFFVGDVLQTQEIYTPKSFDSVNNVIDSYLEWSERK
jgi:hypothetical protein